MADDTPAPDVDTDGEGTPPTPPAATDEDTLGDGGLKALREERKARRDAEARNRLLEEKAARLDELEEATKTEAQKNAERAEKADRRTAELEAELARTRFAADHGLTGTQAEWLKGTTPEELAESLEKLREDFPDAFPSDDEGDDEDDTAPSLPRPPKPALKAGKGDPTKDPALDDPLAEALAAKVGAPR